MNYAMECEEARESTRRILDLKAERMKLEEDDKRQKEEMDRW